MLRAVFFDAAGTLFDTKEPVGSIYARLAHSFGVKADEQTVAKRFRVAFMSAPPLAFGGQRPASELRRLEREWWRQRVAETFAGLGEFSDFNRYFDALFSLFGEPGTWAVAPQARELLRRLKGRGLGLGVISNFDARLYHILEQLGLAEYFESITISSEAGYAKPSAEIFKVALTKHSVAASEALHVGDSVPLDIAGANAAGIAGILIDPEQNRTVIGLTIRGRVSALAEVADIVALELS